MSNRKPSFKKVIDKRALEESKKTGIHIYLSMSQTYTIPKAMSAKRLDEMDIIPIDEN